MGMTWGRRSMREEFGEGMSERRMASAEASSKRRVRRVKTERTRKAMMMKLTSRKMKTPRRMVKNSDQLTEHSTAAIQLTAAIAENRGNAIEEGN